MSILSRLYASGGPEIIYEALKIEDGVNTFRFVKGFEDLILAGELYTGLGIDIALPKRDNSGAQDLTFAIDNTNGEPNRVIREAVAAKRDVTVTLSLFTSDDLTQPAETPISMRVKYGTVTNQQAQITAGYFDLLNTAWPRRLYDMVNFPGLKYL